MCQGIAHIHTGTYIMHAVFAPRPAIAIHVPQNGRVDD
jgi:hypothetical protein